jgi:phosphoglycolate phosphatase
LKAYQGYLFDLDGTLVDTAPDLNAALNHVLRSHGYPSVDETLTRHWVGHGAKKLVLQALQLQKHRHDLTAEHQDELVAAFIGYYEANIAELSQPYPGVVQALSELQQRGAKLAVVTNKLTRLSTPLLSALDLTRFFDVIVCGDTAAAPKPAADPAVHACRSLDIAVEEALFVGDSDTDVRCARAAGCPVVVVRDGYNHGTPAIELGADAVIETFSDLV